MKANIRHARFWRKEELLQNVCDGHDSFLGEVNLFCKRSIVSYSSRPVAQVSGR